MFVSRRGLRRAVVPVVLTAVVALPPAARSQSPPREPYRSPTGVAAKSLVIPGWGQRGNMQKRKGWLFTLNAAVALLFATRTLEIASEGNTAELIQGVFIADYVLNAGLSAYDAYVHAERLNRENGYLLDDDVVDGPGPRGPDAYVVIPFVALRF